MIGYLKKALIAFAVMAVLSYAFTGCGYKEQRNGNSNNDVHGGDGNAIAEESPTKPGKLGSAQDDTIRPDGPQTGEDADLAGDVMKKMNLDEKIGQMFLIGFEGRKADERLKEMICEKHVGGVILFRRNIDDPEQLIGLLNSIKAINAESGNNAGNGRPAGSLPLFISVDEEGGRVSRMPDELAQLPSAAMIGEINDIGFAYDVGVMTAEKIKACGFNMNFAPVLDIWSNPQNTVIGDRSYGQTPDIVASLGIQAMKGMSGKGIIPVVKHFPGHGDTIADSHIELPELSHDLERLNNFELAPFKEAVENGADAVMAGHILVKEVDPSNPATLSESVITGMLRGQLGFEGVIITDDMTMGAIEKNFDMGDAAVKSVIAGCDIIMVCHGHDKQIEAIDAVKAAVADGAISEERIDESVERILKLKKKYGLNDNPAGTVDIEGINKKIEALMAKWYNR